MDNILQVNHVTIRFGGLTAVNDVSLIHNGQDILSLIGPNGAGKTTLFNLLTGIYLPDEGEILFDGKDITGLKPYERVSAGIARTFQNIRLFKNMTVLENLLIAHPMCNHEGLGSSILMGKGLRAKRRKVVEECEEILQSVGLLESEGLMATSLPYGKQRLLEIARALATNPKLILLDEPGAGMNSVEKEELSSVIKFITGQCGKHVLIIEHDMKFVMTISDRIIVLDHGEKIAEGKPEEIQKNRKVIDAYLGAEETGDESEERDHA